MEVYYSISGMSDQETQIELKGTVFFVKNLLHTNYQLNHVYFRQGKLQMDFSPKSGVDTNSRAPRYYLSMLPIRGVVGLRTRTVERIDGTENSKVSYYIISSVKWLGKVNCFKVQKFSGVMQTGMIYRNALIPDEATLLGLGLKLVLDKLVEKYDEIDLF